MSSYAVRACIYCVAAVGVVVPLSLLALVGLALIGF
jgi:hypothetical protein